MSTLHTEDLVGVEILSTGGPIRGWGSDAGGDHYTARDLEAIAAANRALADELQPPCTIGHSLEQRLLSSSGLTAAEQPAIGWLDGRSFRVQGGKLVADVKRVPHTLAQLIRAGAYRGRSAELSRLTSQRSGRQYERVVTGLAWLGAKLPAVRTLDDVVRLYEDGPAGTFQAVVEEAVADGRLPVGSREAARRMLAVAPEAARALLESMPGDPQRALENTHADYWTPENEAAYRGYAASTFGLRDEEIL